MVIVLATLVLGTDLKTSCERFAAVFTIPLIVTLPSATSNRRSIADTSSPVASCRARGVPISKFVMSLLMSRSVPAASSI